MSEDAGESAPPRKRSRFPQPGTLASGCWEVWLDGRYHFVNMDVAVIATSRHKDSLDPIEALSLLREAHGPETAIGRTARWYSVTERDMENGDVGDSAPGDWNEAGSGASWVMVSYPDEATVAAHIGRDAR